ncbi:hypothetical protein HGRIS_011417 [Hohenbuehelia grisea]|uniref:Uncharacterized protein n=1 Tax=Hohenbuehelia grisea TaxID=104357 RepID=A0ABR3JX08_9AGAR
MVYIGYRDSLVCHWRRRPTSSDTSQRHPRPLWNGAIFSELYAPHLTINDANRDLRSQNHFPSSLDTPLMDPLSISIAAASLLKTAWACKESFEKVSRNRLRLQQLATDVVRGMSDIREFCETRQKTNDPTEAQDLRDSLDDITREMSYVHRRCEKLSFRHATKSPLSKARASVLAWLNHGELEAAISRLKERVLACHIRFLTFSSARTEQNVVLLLYEGRARTRQLDQLIGQRLLRDLAHGLPSPVAISEVAPPAEMCHYLRQKITDAIELVNHFTAQNVNWYEEPDEWHTMQCFADPSTQLPPSTTLYSTSLFIVLQTIQVLSLNPQIVSVQGITSSLSTLVQSLHDSAHDTHAALVATVAADLYGHLFENTHSNVFLYHLAWSVEYLSRITKDIDDALKTGGEAVTAWAELYRSSRSHRYGAGLANSLGNYSIILSIAGRLGEALEYSQQSLALIRGIPSVSAESRIVRWEGSGEAAVVLTSQRQLQRPMDIAWIEVHALHIYAWGLGACGQYSNAFLTGLEAINGFQALVETMPESCHAASWGIILGHQDLVPSWVSIARSPSQRRLLHDRLKRTQGDEERR